MSTGKGKDLNLIQQGFGGRWAQFCVDLAKGVGMDRATLHALRLMQRINQSVAASFQKGKAPMRNISNAEIDRRANLCVDLVLVYYNTGWSTIRIYDELPNLLLEVLQAKDTPRRQKHRWVRDHNILLPQS